MLPRGAAGLQVADAQQVVYTLVRGLDMAVHHRCRGRKAEAVRLVHHVEPLFDRRLGWRYGPAYDGVEDLGAGARKRVEPGCHQAAQGLQGRQAADAGDVRHLGRTQRMQPQRGVERFQVGEKPLVEVDAQLRMQAALQQQLVAAQLQRTVDLLAVLGQRGDECPVCLVGLAVEIAEPATRDADVGDVDIAVDLPGHHLRVGNHGAAHLVGHERQLLQRSLVVEPVGLLA